VRSCNELFSGGDTGDATTSASAAQASALDSVSRRVRRFCEFPTPSSAQQCFRDILGTTDEYARAPCTAEPLDVDRLSLRPSGSDPIPLTTLMGGGETGFDEVEKFIASSVLPKEMAAENVAAGGLNRPYTDPAASRNCKTRQKLLSRLFESGMLELCSSPGAATVGLFAVPKRSGGQRLVIDARIANCFFTDSHHCSLATMAGFARLAGSSDKEIFSAQYDLKDAF